MSDEEEDDYPLEPYPDDSQFGGVVVDLAGVRLSRGRAPRGEKRAHCQHQNLVYSTEERRVWCEDCNRTVDTFDAFMSLSRDLHRMVLEVQGEWRKANEFLGKQARLRATKQLDRLWSGRVRAVQCPHCKGGLLPEDFADGARACWDRRMEIAKRRKEREEEKK